jgi:hypothetical protein
MDQVVHPQALRERL